MNAKTCDVAILMGSKSDLATMKPAVDVPQNAALPSPSFTSAGRSRSGVLERG